MADTCNCATVALLFQDSDVGLFVFHLSDEIPDISFVLIICSDREQMKNENYIIIIIITIIIIIN
jgi:hypothetical protein